MRISRLLIAAAIVATCASPSFGYEHRLRKQFEQLDPATRIEQVCDTEILEKVNDADPKLRADRVVAYTFKNPTIVQDRLTANGAAIRSRGKWFHLKYSCQTGPRHLDVHDLSYEIGEEIPSELWTRYYLYD